MNDIQAYFEDLIRLDQETLVLGGIFLAVTLIALSIALFLLGYRSNTKRKLAEIRKSMDGEARVTDGSRKIDNTLESLAPLFSPKSQKERDSVKNQLMHAGFHESSVLTQFYALKMMTTVIGVGAAAGIFFFGTDIPYSNLLMIVAAATGLFLPNFVLHQLVKKRQSKIRNAIPDALDLLVVCTESGLGFNSALKKVSEELEISHPDFADELDTVCAKVNSGVELNDAFEELVKRTGVTEIMGLVKMLAHASRIGGSLAQTLREYTEDYRDRRNQEIEEIAAKIPTKMIFPLLIFIWPCFFIVAVGPSILFLLDALGA
ncbi:type II secretion system F family protein [Vibrio salinus]|uniref:type II secretion system F family protein n=1 Tax=Vibrio salinus TaxID=2899784 RepID=UPI001E358D53|nr:type II secretion system F family protein [Vibrio salinus]MCE0494323.1 type II secretion system F family protein [Vibrio salinus]